MAKVYVMALYMNSWRKIGEWVWKNQRKWNGRAAARSLRKRTGRRYRKLKRVSYLVFHIFPIFSRIINILVTLFVSHPPTISAENYIFITCHFNPFSATKSFVSCTPCNYATHNGIILSGIRGDVVWLLLCNLEWRMGEKPCTLHWHREGKGARGILLSYI